MHSPSFKCISTRHLDLYIYIYILLVNVPTINSHVLMHRHCVPKQGVNTLVCNVLNVYIKLMNINLSMNLRYLYINNYDTNNAKTILYNTSLTQVKSCKPNINVSNSNVKLPLLERCIYIYIYIYIYI